MSEIKNYLDRMVEERNRAWHEAKDMLSAANAEGRSLTAEEREKYDRIDADLDAKDAEIKRLSERAERDAEYDVIREAHAPAEDAARREAERFVKPAGREERTDTSFDALDAFLRGESRSAEVNIAAAARERQLVRSGMAPVEVRDLLVGTAASGGTAVPTTFERMLYDFLEVYTGLRRTNVKVITTAAGENIDMPTVTAHGTAAIVGEGTALAEADPAFSKVTLGAYKYAQLLQISSELLSDIGVDIRSFIAEDTARALARATDTAYVTGSGTNQPQGIVGIYATAVTGQTGATGLPSYTNLVDMVYSINEEYRARGASWLWKDSTVGKLRTIVDTTNRPIWEPSSQVGTPDRLLGYPVLTDPNLNTMATGVAVGVFGDFSCHVIRDVAGIRFERSDEYAFANDLVTFRSVLRTDSRKLDGAGIRIYKGGTV